MGHSVHIYISFSLSFCLLFFLSHPSSIFLSNSHTQIQSAICILFIFSLFPSLSLCLPLGSLSFSLSLSFYIVLCLYISLSIYIFHSFFVLFFLFFFYFLLFISIFSSLTTYFFVSLSLNMVFICLFLYLLFGVLLSQKI